MVSFSLKITITISKAPHFKGAHTLAASTRKGRTREKISTRENIAESSLESDSMPPFSWEGGRGSQAALCPCAHLDVSCTCCSFSEKCRRMASCFWASWNKDRLQSSWEGSLISLELQGALETTLKFSACYIQGSSPRHGL